MNQEQSRNIETSKLASQDIPRDYNQSVFNMETDIKIIDKNSFFKYYPSIKEIFKKNYKRFLSYINEYRGDRRTYKKYLLITLSGKEIKDLSNGVVSTIVRKAIPEWVKNEINKGNRIEALFYVKSERPLYFKYGISSTHIEKFIVNTGYSGFTSAHNDIIILNALVCAKGDITNIIKSSVKENGKYDDNINAISILSKTSKKVLEGYGKIKPIYSIDIKNINIFPKPLLPSTFMKKFTVRDNRNHKYKYSLEVIKTANVAFSNMGTVWA